MSDREKQSLFFFFPFSFSLESSLKSAANLHQSAPRPTTARFSYLQIRFMNALDNLASIFSNFSIVQSSSEARCPRLTARWALSAIQCRPSLWPRFSFLFPLSSFWWRTSNPMSRSPRSTTGSLTPTSDLGNVSMFISSVSRTKEKFLVWWQTRLLALFELRSVSHVGIPALRAALQIL